VDCGVRRAGSGRIPSSVYGAEAVTYKDRSAGLLGKELASGVFLMLTKIHKFYEG
jgi:carbamate kinase